MEQFSHETITWEFLLGFASTWRLWVPLLLLLILVGWLTRRRFGGRLLLVSLALLAVLSARVIWREWALREARIEAWNRLRVPLTTATNIDGLQLAGGTVVRWNQREYGHLITADLNAGQTVAPNVVLRGEINQESGWWRGTLANDSVIQGWHCAAGKFDWYTNGRLRWCVLSESQKLPAGEIPARTAVLLENGIDPENVLLHLPNVGMFLRPGRVFIQPDGWFVLTANGEVKSR